MDDPRKCYCGCHHPVVMGGMMHAVPCCDGKAIATCDEFAERFPRRDRCPEWCPERRGSHTRCDSLHDREARADLGLPEVRCEGHLGHTGLHHAADWRWSETKQWLDEFLGRLGWPKFDQQP